VTATERGAALGIRPVPQNPDPREFPGVPYACDLRPAKCGQCSSGCRYGIQRFSPAPLDEGGAA
jgi:hypothetical protein